MPDLNSSGIGFGRRLREERERRKIPLSSIAETTKISTSLLQQLERDDLSRWPTGIFRRSFVRAYASAIGLNPDETVREFVERYPDPDDGPAILPADAAGTRLPDPAAPSSPSTTFPHLRLRIVAAARAFQRGAILDEKRRRWAAAAWDAGVLLAITLLLFIVVNSFWKPFGVLTLAYYVCGIVLLGNTPGVCLFASVPDSEDRGARASTMA